MRGDPSVLRVCDKIYFFIPYLGQRGVVTPVIGVCDAVAFSL